MVPKKKKSNIFVLFHSVLCHFRDFLVLRLGQFSILIILQYIIPVISLIIGHSFLSREADMTKERIEKLLKAGANVVLTTKGIDDMALKVSVFH